MDLGALIKAGLRRSQGTPTKGEAQYNLPPH
jgi:hypothetical protein